MKNQSASSIHFQRKISEFCDLPIAPLVSQRTLENIKPYLASLIIYRKPPPMRMGRIDWQSVGEACGLADELSAGLKKNLQSGLEAIARWAEKELSKEDDQPVARTVARKPTAPSSILSNRRTAPSSGQGEAAAATSKAKPGVPPKPVEEFRHHSSTGPKTQAIFSRR